MSCISQRCSSIFLDSRINRPGTPVFLFPGMHRIPLQFPQSSEDFLPGIFVFPRILEKVVKTCVKALLFRAGVVLTMEWRSRDNFAREIVTTSRVPMAGRPPQWRDPAPKYDSGPPIARAGARSRSVRIKLPRNISSPRISQTQRSAAAGPALGLRNRVSIFHEFCQILKIK